MSDKIKMELVFQIGLCVDDLEAVMQNWKDLVDFDHNSILFRSTKELYEAGGFDGADMYNGKKVEPWFIKYYRFDLGNLDIEIIEPLDKKPGSPYSDFLIEHGNGVHHIAIKVQDRAVFHKRMQELGRVPYLKTEMGEVLADGERKNCFFYDLRDLLGMMIESGSLVVGPMASHPLANNPQDYIDR